jgi:ubiquinone/menaquinone biosynthesis C-methylase UbiE
MGDRTMNIFKKVLGGIDGDKVLYVATQEGGFVQILIENLKSYQEIVGIDINEHAIQTARDRIIRDEVRFLVMDAEQLDFKDGSFDTVSISASLHHMSNVQRVLEEMRRVLKTGGHFILAEMHRDGRTEAELTSVYLHQWAAEVDSALGRVHNHTFSRQALVDYVESMELSDIGLYDSVERDPDPLETTRIEQLEGLIERLIKRAEGAKNDKELIARGELLRKRLREVGAQREPILLVIGSK